MIVKPICAAYDVNRKFGFNATEAITIEHEEDFKTRFIDLFLYENNIKNAVDVSGATVTARMVTTPEFDSLLLNDNVSCSIGEKQGHIVVPIDKAVLPSYPCEFLVEIHIENGEDVLVLPFPLWVKMNASILDDAGVTPESKGTVPELLEEATQALEAAEEAIEESDSHYHSIQEELNGKEDKANKVTEITDDNTAAQYPTAVAVRNYRNALLEKSRKNLIAFPNVTIDNNGVHYSINNNWITVSGTADTTSNAYGIIDFATPIELEAGTYMASIRDEENPPSNVMIYFYIQGSDDIAFQINGGGAKKRKYEPTETVFIRRVIIGVGAGKDASTAQTKTTAFYLQLEKGDEATDYEPPVDTYKIKNSLIPDNIPDKAYVKKAVNPMNYIYVSNDYDESTEGFGEIYFNSIIAANDSITDNSKETPYTIIVKSGTTAEPCVYDEFEDLYGDEFDKQYDGNTDEIPLQGIRTKNYVYYESETPDNPAACVLKWDGVEGYLKWDGEKDYKEGELTNELATKKCIFHLVNGLRGMHTHIKGFTIESKNTRYGIHMESGGYGRNEEWVVENCIIEYGGRPDVYKGDVTPIIGMGMSPHEKGTIRNVKAFFSDGFTSGTRALNCHDNYETTVYRNVPSVKVGAKLTIDNCDFSDNAIGLSKGNTEITDPVSDTPFNVYLINNVNISETVVASGNWVVIDLTTAEEETSISEANISLSSTNFVYDGSSHVPNVSAVTLNGQTLTPNVDYVVVSVPATNAGDYVITINGIGNYSGTATAEWTISKAQSTISGDNSILIRGVGNSLTKTYTTNGDGAFSFSISNNIATLSNTGGAVTVTAVSVGSGNITVSVGEGQNYLGATKTVSLTIDDSSSANVFGVVWDYSLSSPELTRLTPQTDPLNVVTAVPTQEPTACIGTEGGQSDFDNYMPWAGMQRFNYVNGQIVDFVDYTNGETYVYIPEFWSKAVNDSENQKMYLYISDSELTGFTKHLGSGRYVGRYACDVNYASKPNGEPKHRISISNFRTGVTALDNKHYLIDIHSFSAIQLLYIIEFANLNSQSKIGEGLTNVSQIQNLGLTDVLTYHTGRTAGVNDQSAVHYRWVENLWGNVSEYVDGILTSGTKVYFCDDYTHYDNVINSFYYDTNLELPNLNNEFVATENCFNNGYLLPKTVGASSTTYTCDRIFLALGTRVMRVGGIFNSTNAAGIFAVSYSDSPTDTPTNCCGRSILILNTGGNS